MNKKKVVINATIFIVTILILFGVIRAINRIVKESYTEGSYDGYNHIVNWLTIGYDEREYPTNCSMEKFPYYLTTTELSMSELDNNRTFWIMLVSRTQWNCTPRVDYGKYGNHSNWCYCHFIG